MGSNDTTTPGRPWSEIHAQALRHPVTQYEHAIVGMFNAWRLYGQAHRASLHYLVGEDQFLGDAWESIGVALLVLLNGETGRRLDCGLMDTMIRKVLESEGRPQ